MVTDILVLIAAGFGLGFSPLLPATAGALLGLPVSYWLSKASVYKQFAGACCLTLVAVPVCGWAAETFAAKDAPRIVADEYLTFPVAALALPCAKHPALLITAFAASRILDHLKPPPVAQVERAPGGIGMVLDDVVSNLYALGLTWLSFAAYSRHRQRGRRGTAEECS